MKKLVGILGIVAIAIAMSISTNATNRSNGDVDLANIFNINTANAECPVGAVGKYYIAYVDQGWGSVKLCLIGGSDCCE